MANIPRNASSPDISSDWDRWDVTKDRKSLDDDRISVNTRKQYNVPDNKVPKAPKPAKLKSSKTIKPTKNAKPVKPPKLNKGMKNPNATNTGPAPITAKDISEPRLVLATNHTNAIQSENSQPNDSPTTTRSKIFDLIAELQIENQIKMGAENLLQVYDREKKEERKQQATSELDAANHKISRLREQLERLGVTKYDQFPNTAKPDIKTSTDKPKPNNPIYRTNSPIFSLTDILESLEAHELSPEFLIEQSNSLVTLLSQNPELRNELALSKIGAHIRRFLLHRRTEVVAAGYRMTRHVLSDSTSTPSLENVKVLIDSTMIELSFVIVRSLAKDAKCQLERLHALKLARLFLDIPNCTEIINTGIIRSLVAVAEQTDEKLRSIAIETLAEAFVREPGLVYQGEGNRILIQAVTEGPFEISVALTMSFAYSIDNPEYRKFLRNGRDLEYFISSFTDYQRNHTSIERLKINSAILASLLKTWPGLCVFANHEQELLKDLVSCFQYPVPAIRECLLDLFFSLFHIRPKNAWTAAYVAGRKLPAADISEYPSSGHSKLRDHYISLLLVLFMKCDLIKNLTIVFKDSEDLVNSRRAALLLVELMNLGSRVLPHDQLAELVRLGGTWSFDSDDDDGKLKTLNGQLHSALVFQIDSISRNVRASAIKPASAQLPLITGTENTMPTAFEIKKQIGVQIDDNSFKQLLVDTQVLNTKTHSKWNWDALTDLIQGPLLNPKRLDDTVRNTKFMKRLMSFYRPFKYRFSSIKNTRPNLKCVRVGQELIHTLLQTSYGVKYLTENKLLRQIAECLAQIDPMSGITSPDPLFSPSRLENTLSHGYFSMLGTLSADPNGMAMMERWRMFNMFYHIAELRSREDLIVSFIRNMDYKLVGHPRIIFAKALTTGQKNVRLAGTAHLRTLISSQKISKDRATTDTQQWAIRLLATQLFDPEIEVCKLAVSVLDEFCSKSVSNLKFFVDLQPSLDHLGDISSPLLLKFLSTSQGFKYLKESDYVLQEMEKWFEGGMNESYVNIVEEHIERVQRTWSFLGQSDEKYDKQPYDDSIAAAAAAVGLGPTTANPSSVPGSGSKGFGEDEEEIPIPRHFYGELTLTDDGCQLLRTKGHYELFCEYVRQYGLISNAKSLTDGKCSTRFHSSPTVSNVSANESNGHRRHFLHGSKTSVLSEMSSLPLSLQSPVSEKFLSTPFKLTDDGSALFDDEYVSKIILKLKGCLWAIGHASMNTLGINFLDSSNIATDIITIAEKSRIASVKGTAFFVLGLLANTIDGAEILEDLGWKTKRMWNEGEVDGISIPENLNKMFRGRDKPHSRYKGLDEDGKDCLSEEIEAKRRLVNEGFLNFDQIIPAISTKRSLYQLDDSLSTNPFPNLKHLWEFSQLEPVEVLYPYDLSTDSSVKSSDVSDSDESLDSDLEPFPSYTPNPNNNGPHSNTLASQNKDARRKYKSATKAKDSKNDDGSNILANASLHPFHKTLLCALSDLSNQILANDASKTLVQLSRNTYSFPEGKEDSIHAGKIYPLSSSDKLFKSTLVFRQVMMLLSKYRYRQPMRKFVFELFDAPALMEKMAREKEKSVIAGSIIPRDDHESKHPQRSESRDLNEALNLESRDKLTRPLDNKPAPEIEAGKTEDRVDLGEDKADSGLDESDAPLTLGNMIVLEADSDDDDVMLPFPG